jgi:hypothetical protein
MGAWDIGSFDNDDALDWVERLAHAQDSGILHEALSLIVQSTSYLETPQCCDALAAAEVVAAMQQRPAPKLPAGVLAFIGRIAAPPSPELLQIAARSVESINAKSELQELWDDSMGAKQWHDDVSNLLERLT